MQFLVLCLHSRPFMDNKYMDYIFTNMITTLAVPIFATYTGFFLFQKKDIYNGRKVFLYVKRLFILYCIWTVLYLPMIILDYSQNDKYLSYTLCDYIVNFVRRFFFLGAWTPLWYYPSLIYAVIFAVYIKRVWGNKALLGMAFVMYILGCLIDSWAWLLPSVIRFSMIFEVLTKLAATKNAFLFILMFISVGALLAELELPKIKKKYVLLGIVVGHCIEQYIGGSQTTHSQGFFMILIVSFIVRVSLMERSIFKIDTRFLRKLSLLVYMLHPICLYFIRVENRTLLTLYCFFICIIVGSIIILLTKIKMFKFLEILL